jgi:glycosyltransferase involved in cell wall biosynthesis
MRIAVLTSLFPSRARPHEGLFAERRWRAMAARGHQVRIVQPLPHAPPAWVGGLLGRPHWSDLARTADEIRSGLEVRRPRYAHLPGRASANAQRFARAGARSILDGGRPDVVVADYAWPAARAAARLREAGVPCVISGRGSDVLLVAQDPQLARELAQSLEIAGHWCAVSQHLVRAMDGLARAPGRGALVPNGVDLQLFRILDRDRARHRLGVAVEPLLVLVVGHLIERKDPLLALESFARGVEAPGRLVFVGEGPLAGAVRSRAKALGLAERVHLLGERPTEVLVEWYGASDLVLLASKREGRPNVVLEALACGRPVLATDAGGTSELLEGFEAFLARSRDPQALGAQLRGLLAGAHDPQALRAHVAPLSWERSLDALEAVLRQAIGGRPAVRSGDLAQPEAGAP